MKKGLLTSLACLLLITVFNFALPRLMPGDTVLMLVGMDEAQVSEQEYAFYLEKTGADRPLPEQFGDYLFGILIKLLLPLYYILQIHSQFPPKICI